VTVGQAKSLVCRVSTDMQINNLVLSYSILTSVVFYSKQSCFCMLINALFISLLMACIQIIRRIVSVIYHCIALGLNNGGADPHMVRNKKNMPRLALS